MNSDSIKDMTSENLPTPSFDLHTLRMFFWQSRRNQAFPRLPTYCKCLSRRCPGI